MEQVDFAEEGCSSLSKWTFPEKRLIEWLLFEVLRGNKKPKIGSTEKNDAIKLHQTYCLKIENRRLWSVMGDLKVCASENITSSRPARHFNLLFRFNKMRGPTVETSSWILIIFMASQLRWLQNISKNSLSAALHRCITGKLIFFSVVAVTWLSKLLLELFKINEDRHYDATNYVSLSTIRLVLI